MTRLYIVADDSMQGRQAGTPGHARAARYLAAELARLGLEPAGDAGTFLQAIPLVSRGLDPAARLRVDTATLRADRDYVLLPAMPPVLPFGGSLRGSSVPVVYGGRVGDPAPLEPGAVAGKLVVLDAPLGPTGRPTFQFWAVGGLDRYAGAAGVALATLDLSPPPLLEYLREPQMVLARDGAVPSPRFGLLVTRAAAERMLGSPLEGLQPGAAGRTLDVDLRFAERPTEVPAENVVAILRGSDPLLRDEYVALGSHLDHVGLQLPAVDHDSLRVFNAVMRPQGLEDEHSTPTGAQAVRIRMALDSMRAHRPARLDSIANGADDDASGVVAMLEVAEALAALPRKPRRSVLFVWHTAEEMGLLGSEHFTDQPTVPREAIVAQLNLDMIGRGQPADVRGGGPHYLALVGSRRLSTRLGDLVEAINRQNGHGFSFDYQWDADGHPQNLYCRSDHYNYARFGIPVVFFSTGLHRDYHMVTDEPQYVDYDHLTRVTRYLHDLTQGIADLDARPPVDRPRPEPGAPCQQ